MFPEGEDDIYYMSYILLLILFDTFRSHLSLILAAEFWAYKKFVLLRPTQKKNVFLNFVVILNTKKRNRRVINSSEQIPIFSNEMLVFLVINLSILS